MSLRIERTESEWLVAKSGRISLCVGVVNGRVDKVKIVGLAKTDDYTTWTEWDRVQSLFDAINVMRQEIRVAQLMTTLPGVKDDEG